MSYALSAADAPARCATAAQAPGCPVGPYTVDDGIMSLGQRLSASWGAWPDPNHPEVLSNNGRSGVTMSTSQALTSLKYQVVTIGVGALVLGGILGGWLGRKSR